MTEVELELTYLVKKLPTELIKSPSKVIVDFYYPASGAAEHPSLRIRQNGDRYEITKKLSVDGEDFSHQQEHTIKLSQQEYDELTKNQGRRVAKRRYFYSYNGRTAEIDVFLDDLQGLALVDFEFADRKEQLAFIMPDFCLADVTQETAIAGGMLAGKAFADLQQTLEQYGYSKIADPETALT